MAKIGALAVRMLRAGASGARRAAALVRRAGLRNLLLVLFGLWSLGLLFLAWCAFTLPINGGRVVEGPQTSLALEAANGEVFATRGVFKGERIAFDLLPRDLVEAVIAIEDRRFYSHPGIDLWGIARALVANTLAGGVREGASTITQQLAKLTFLSPERTVKRKVQEMMLALWLESQLTKEEILARYLNTAYFGAGAYGIDAASRRYFGKKVQALSLAEAAMLAGLVRAPSAYAPNRNLEAARQRAELVLAAMVETGYLAPERAAEARARPAQLKVLPETSPARNWYADAVEADMRRLLGTVPADLTVRTTLDLELQEIAERVTAERLAKEGAAKNVHQAALVAMSHDGAILAMVGGRDYNESQFNRAVQARRQPGSLFKLFVYLAALDAGFTPDSVVVDQPVRIGDWEPKNYGGRFRGPVTLRTAFADSINTVAVQLAQQVGPERVAAIAASLGVQSELAPVPSLALGTAEVTLLEMTRAFAAVAANAGSVEPYTVDSVRARDQPLYTHQKRAVEPPSWRRREIVDLLLTAVRSGTGKSAALARPVAGKTGTTQDNRDAWFIGFTADAVVGVWVGNDDNTPMKNVVGGDLPAKIFHDFMLAADKAKAEAPAAAAAPPPPAAPEPPPTQAAPPGPPPRRVSALHGFPAVVDTATLRIGNETVRLFGVEGEGGRLARELALYLGNREIFCEPAGGSFHRCSVGDYDLAEIVVFNGGGRVSPDAPAQLRAAEEEARRARRGIWRNY